MRRAVVAAVVVAGAALPCRAVPAAEVRPVFMKGIALGLYFENEKLVFETMLGEIAALGASHVELVVQWVQEDVRAVDITPDGVETVPDKRLREVIRAARAKGLRVFLLPIVHLRRRAMGEWRGTLAPADWNAWWGSYRRFLLHYAALSASEGVDIFSVGSELVSTEGMRGRWQALVADVRAVFRGRLLYSANWDHYEPVSFWDLVDLAGLTGYYRLTEDAEASEDALAVAWATIRDTLVRFQGRVGRPLVFTEVGYPSQDGAAIHPWDYTTGRPIDLEEQRRCYEAFRRAWQGDAALGGVFFWNWFGYGGPRSAYYTPKGKPAEAVIRTWYGASGQADRP